MSNIIRATIFICAVLFCLAPVYGQITNIKLPKSKQKKSGEYDTVAYQRASQLAEESVGLLEKEVDPQTYILGPGDVVSLFIPRQNSDIIDLAVSPDGTILIPEVGQLKAAGTTLHQSQELISRKVKSVIKTDVVEISLKRMRKFKVAATGSVRKPITTSATPADRVSEVLDRSGGLSEKASLRKIIIRRLGNPTPIRVDLLRYYIIGDTSANPYVQGGDIIYVPISAEKNVVEILGEVAEETTVEYNTGDMLSDAIKFAGGITNSSQLDSVEIARFLEDGKTIYSMYFDLRAWQVNENIIAPPGADIPLQSGDRVIIRSKPKWHKRSVVAINGEVAFPGHYVISIGTTRVSDLIAKSGGITAQAALERSVLLRTEDYLDFDKEYFRLIKIPISEMTESEQRYFKARARETKGAMSIDFKKLIFENSEEDNILLRPNDSIYIPTQKNYVNVIGKVINPGKINYKNGLSYLDYINLAGGFGYRADEDETKIIKPNGEEFLATKESIVGAEDNIMVPEQSEAKFIDIFTTALTVATQLVTIAGIAITLSR